MVSGLSGGLCSHRQTRVTPLPLQTGLARAASGAVHARNTLKAYRVTGDVTHPHRGQQPNMSYKATDQQSYGTHTYSNK